MMVLAGVLQNARVLEAGKRQEPNIAVGADRAVQFAPLPAYCCC